LVIVYGDANGYRLKENLSQWFFGVSNDLGEEADEQYPPISISITKVHVLDRTSGKVLSV